MLRGVGKDEFQRRPDMRLDEMARHRATIAPAEHDVNVDRRTIVRIDADIAGERRDLDLIVHRDFAIILLVPVEIGEERVAEGTNSRNLRSPDLLPATELPQTGHHLVSRLKDSRDRAQSAGVVNDLAMHAPTPAPRHRIDRRARFNSVDVPASGGFRADGALSRTFMAFCAALTDQPHCSWM